MLLRLTASLAAALSLTITPATAQDGWGNEASDSDTDVANDSQYIYVDNEDGDESNEYADSYSFDYNSPSLRRGPSGSAAQFLTDDDDVNNLANNGDNDDNAYYYTDDGSDYYYTDNNQDGLPASPMLRKLSKKDKQAGWTAEQKEEKRRQFLANKAKKEAEAAAAAQAELEAIAKREREAEKKKAQKQKQNQQKQQKEITAFEKEFQELLEAQKQMEATFNNGGKVDDDDEDMFIVSQHE